MKITKRQLRGLIREMFIKEYGDAQAIIRRGRYPDTKPQTTSAHRQSLTSQLYEAVIEVLEGRPGMSGAELVDTVNQMLPSVDAELIYDFLDELLEDGEVFFDVEEDAWSLT